MDFFSEMENRKVEVMSVNENLDTSTAIGRAVRDIILRMAQLERENISEATQQRLKALKDSGKPIGRPRGSKDSKARRKSGYYLRWSNDKNKM
jgi:DNA invertase Pin-like site-specific DNA recombinase